MNESEKIRWVYSQLEDDESRFIFEKRNQFYLTNDYRYIGEIVDKYVPEFSDCKWSPEILRKLFLTIKEKGMNVIIFGAGYHGRRLLQLSYGGGVKVDYFCDSSSEKWNTKVDGVPVIALDELIEQKLINNHVIIISPMLRNVYEEIFDLLIEHGIPECNIYKYADYYFIKALSEKQYFDKVITLGEDEVFVDGGSYDFSNSEIFINNVAKLGMKYKKIYAFEPDMGNVKRCKEKINNLAVDKIELLPYGLGSVNEYQEFFSLGNASSYSSKFQKLSESGVPLKGLGTVPKKVKVISLDSYIYEKVTFIKMDIEGVELEALKGAKNILLNDRPKLAICIYHKKEDLWEIPYYIKTLVPEYKLYIRHYGNYLYETVLYAI